MMDANTLLLWFALHAGSTIVPILPPGLYFYVDIMQVGGRA